MDFTMRLAPRPYKGGVNYSDMQLRGFTADLDGLSIGGGDIVMGIDRLVFTERSGFEVRDMSVEKFTIRDGKLLFEHLNIQTPDSFLSLPHLYLVGDAWSSYKNFTDSVEVDAVSAGSTVSTASLQYFVPSLAGRSLTLEDVDLSTRKTVSELEVSLTRASAYSSEIALEAVSRGLPDLDKARIDVHVSKLATSAAGINAIMRGFAGRTLPQSVARMISNAGKIHVKGDSETYHVRERIELHTDFGVLSEQTGRRSVHEVECGRGYQQPEAYFERTSLNSEYDCERTANQIAESQDIGNRK